MDRHPPDSVPDARSGLRFVLVNGLFKVGLVCMMIYSGVEYLAEFGLSLPKDPGPLNLWALVYKPILMGTAVGLIVGLLSWRKKYREEKKV